MFHLFKLVFIPTPDLDLVYIIAVFDSFNSLR